MINNYLRDPSQWLSLLLMMCTLYLMYHWTKRDMTRTLWAVPVASWLVHGIIFYTYVQLSLYFPAMPDGFFSGWSAVVRLHGYITVFTLMYTLNKLNGRVDHGKH